MFSQEDLELIRWTVAQYSPLSRTELARTICENLDWKAPNGKEQFHSYLDLSRWPLAGISLRSRCRSRNHFRCRFTDDEQILHPNT